MKRNPAGIPDMFSDSKDMFYLDTYKPVSAKKWIFVHRDLLSSSSGAEFLQHIREARDSDCKESWDFHMAMKSLLVACDKCIRKSNMFVDLWHQLSKIWLKAEVIKCHYCFIDFLAFRSQWQW